ncbi:MAG: hypothetical protein ACQCN3_02740 [Candidatus Bathyarchaeia archaeon]
MNTSPKKLALAIIFLIGCALIAHGTVNAVTVNKLNTVTDPYGFTFGLSSDPFTIGNTETKTLTLTVWTGTGNYPQVYFKLYVDGALISQGYGQGKDNVVNFPVTITGSSYSVQDTPIQPLSNIYGEHQITATAQVNTNPEIQISGKLYITLPNSNPVPTTTEPIVIPPQTARLTVKVYDNPTDSFNLVSIFDEDGAKIAYSQTTLSTDGDYYYAKKTLEDQKTYHIQVECAGYLTQIQTVPLNGPTIVSFNMEPLSNPLDDQNGQGTPVGEAPTGELNYTVLNNTPFIINLVELAIGLVLTAASVLLWKRA